mmetsp:Transcript_36389/g.104621  ORF Transcript_36389/g.104621 Transcript_36389/m.104621 type:complete len:226 (+) Transcript_36389:836-1513(+)
MGSGRPCVRSRGLDLSLLHPHLQLVKGFLSGEHWHLHQAVDLHELVPGVLTNFACASAFLQQAFDFVVVQLQERHFRNETVNPRSDAEDFVKSSVDQADVAAGAEHRVRLPCSCRTINDYGGIAALRDSCRHKRPSRPLVDFGLVRLGPEDAIELMFVLASPLRGQPLVAAGGRFLRDANHIFPRHPDDLVAVDGAHPQRDPHKRLAGHLRHAVGAAGAARRHVQ